MLPATMKGKAKLMTGSSWMSSAQTGFFAGDNESEYHAGNHGDQHHSYGLVINSAGSALALVRKLLRIQHVSPLDHRSSASFGGDCRRSIASGLRRRNPDR
jgi:hypothetical protein